MNRLKATSSGSHTPTEISGAQEGCFRVPGELDPPYNLSLIDLPTGLAPAALAVGSGPCDGRSVSAWYCARAR